MPQSTTDVWQRSNYVSQYAKAMQQSAKIAQPRHHIAMTQYRVSSGCLVMVPMAGLEPATRRRPVVSVHHGIGARRLTPREWRSRRLGWLPRSVSPKVAAGDEPPLNSDHGSLACRVLVEQLLAVARPDTSGSCIPQRPDPDQSYVQFP
jgi:hypothetical protein